MREPGLICPECGRDTLYALGADKTKYKCAYWRCEKEIDSSELHGQKHPPEPAAEDTAAFELDFYGYPCLLEG